MKIILKEDVTNLGLKGEIKEVKPGFARNYLLPKNLATEATKKAIKKVEDNKSKMAQEELKIIKEAELVAQKIKGKIITISVKAEKNGKLFGAISSQEIAENIKKQTKVEVDSKNIEITEPIKKVGNYKVKIKLHKKVQIDLNLKIVAQN